MVKHVVLVKAKPGTTESQVEESFKALAALVGVVPGLLDFAGGRDVSVESRAQGYTHGFVMTFEDVKARDGYLPHPEHQRAAAKLREWRDEILIVDF